VSMPSSIEADMRDGSVPGGSGMDRSNLPNLSSLTTILPVSSENMSGRRSPLTNS